MASTGLIARLEKWTVIPDVIDPFTPFVEAKITYGNKTVITGNALRVEETQDAPEVTWVPGSVDEGALYTLVMVDPDAPKSQEPSMREYLHWIVANIPGTTDAHRQKEVMEESTVQVVPYKGPSPPEGNHRYVFVFYKQQQGKVDLPASSERKNFNVRSFAKEHNLGAPVYADFFIAAREVDYSGAGLHATYRA